ncbi:MAG: Asp-tRNA(Asn)/Glu-tRNA(Gln) amidotransferase GatCAB subunit A [Alphaproteobacteria bacterium]|jgi:aspartyl-tRNA(Asn)/glutamyl-tRNA(Gln) amidotransferase subunit A|nr:Asp-tRNA(Asn)/Glu-tRNA(Gln) amidotransferase GatCAB subunit A [Alphaproteobacteria bacterium]
MSELATIEATAAALRAGEVSAVELADAALAALERVDPELHVLVEGEPERARAQARLAQAGLDGGDPRPLLGVPMAHKDMFYRAGRISACGSTILADHRPGVTATALARLDAAGAVDLGRLHMVEVALGLTGHNPVTGTPRNPWHTAHVTGGSSSGSAAAVAAGAVYAALGSDTGGSIRIPASCCGVVGVKPTYGRVSRYGAMPLAASLDHVGPLCRSVRDAALVLQAVAGHDPDDPLSADEPVPDYLADIEAGAHGLVLGVPEARDLAGVEEPQLAAFDQAVQTFQRLGCGLRRVPLDAVRDANAVANVVIGVEGATVHARALRERPDELGPQTRARLRSGLFVPATRYLEALSLRARMLEELLDAGLGEVDALMLPALDDQVPTIAGSDVAANPGYMTKLSQFARWFRPLNVLGLPALAMPTGFDAQGLPIAGQLVGRPFDEATLLRTARAFERETGFTGRRPPVHAETPG